MSARSHVEKLQKDKDFVSSLKKKLRHVQRDVLDTPCWEWQGGKDKAGYGRIHVKRHCERKTGRNFFSHRIVYMVFTGAYIEPEEYILHQCHNRVCCNPDHFLLGDHQENMDDLHDSRRVAGEKNSNSKLKEEEVWEILCLYHDEGYSMREISEEYGVARGTISDIVYGRTWGDLYDEFVGEEDES